ncbi:MAG: efflux transporter outer membrane subunit [Gemmataceae bacterium]
MASRQSQPCSVQSRVRLWLGAVLLACALTGCTTLREYCENGLKVGPNYARPPAPVASQWVDQSDSRVRTDPDEHRQWWKVFNDPVLDDLICAAYHQNLELRQQSFRVLELEAILGTVIGRLFPQQQSMQGGYQRVGLSQAVANRQGIIQRFYSQWAYGVGLAWEIDLWGKYRRNIESFEGELNAGIEEYDDILVKLLGDVATTYNQYRVLDTQLALVRANVELQRETLKIAQARFRGGLVSELDVDQSESILQQTLAMIPQLEIELRIAQNHLCVLMGIPVEDLAQRLGRKAIATTAPEVILGVPAELLKRRPDVRRAEREAAARCARIGIAESEWYPAVTISGTIGYQAEFFPNLFDTKALEGVVGPAFHWNILHYGRIANNVLRTEANFQRAVVHYQNTVLKANEDVENAVVRFLKSQQKARELAKSVQAAEKAVRIALAQYRSGQVDFNRVSLLEQNLVQQQVLEAQARGEIVTGLIGIYRSLGGGWQVRLDGCATCSGGLSPHVAPQEKLTGDKENFVPQPRPDQDDKAKPSNGDNKNNTPEKRDDDKNKNDSQKSENKAVQMMEEKVIPTRLPPRAALR